MHSYLYKTGFHPHIKAPALHAGLQVMLASGAATWRTVGPGPVLQAVAKLDVGEGWEGKTLPLRFCSARQCCADAAPLFPHTKQ